VILRSLVACMIFSMVHAQSTEWIRSTMTVQPYPYPYVMTFNGGIENGPQVFRGMRILPMEMDSWARLGGLPRPLYYCNVVGKSGKLYNSKFCLFRNAEIEDEEWWDWDVYARIYEEPTALQIYAIGPDMKPYLWFEKKASPEPPVVEIQVKELSPGNIAWKVGLNLPDEYNFRQPVVSLSLDSGKSWNGWIGEQWNMPEGQSDDASKKLIPGIPATYSFELIYDFRRYMKYYTIGKGFSDTAPTISQSINKSSGPVKTTSSQGISPGAAIPANKSK